ncbi:MULTISPECIES: ATP-binding cassette domain-containing protein [Methanosarcina]|uniref:ATP-binding cassette domain-containing protein n=2 Tax=Methanosarcina TaxID=2207 RepID=UPI002E792892|nr:ATP-binding cassette domain-containing protein [Methanosarcina barkeri]
MFMTTLLHGRKWCFPTNSTMWGGNKEKTRQRNCSKSLNYTTGATTKLTFFSKGMKRRLTLAMGLVNSPRLLFMDEPTSGLDVNTQDWQADLNGVASYLWK